MNHLVINLAKVSSYFHTITCFPSHGRSDSNARHLVLETSALPTELHPSCVFFVQNRGAPFHWRATRYSSAYFTISVT